MLRFLGVAIQTIFMFGQSSHSSKTTYKLDPGKKYVPKECSVPGGDRLIVVYNFVDIKLAFTTLSNTTLLTRALRLALRVRRVLRYNVVNANFISTKLYTT